MDRSFRDLDRREKEIKKMLGNKDYYYAFLAEVLIYELAIFIFGAGFAYIIFCVVLRKSEVRGRNEA